MLKIIFSDGIESKIDMTREEADEQISMICNSANKWVTLKAVNSSATYNKELIAIMESK